MSEVSISEYRGLPIPDADEYELLCKLQQGDEPGHSCPEDIYDVVQTRRPLIARAIEETAEFRGKVEQCDTEELRAEVKEGVVDGMEFFIGSITYLHFLRSSCRSVREFVDQVSQDSPALPLRERYQFEHVIAYLQGKIIVGKAFEPMTITSLESCTTDAGEYFFGAYRFETYLDNEFRAIKKLTEDEDDSLLSAYTSGFRTGIASAVSLYQQSHKEYLLEKLDFEPRIDPSDFE